MGTVNSSLIYFDLFTIYIYHIVLLFSIFLRNMSNYMREKLFYPLCILVIYKSFYYAIFFFFA